jgi:PAS domain S-box-containing protein
VKPLHLTPNGKAAEPASAAEDENRRIKILLVDDQPANLLALESLLEGREYEIVKAFSGPEGLRCLLEQEFALVLLDVLMPGMDGFETAALIRQRQTSRDTPIIFITATSSNETHVGRGYSLGAVDYIYKPIVPEILKAKVQVFADLYRKTQRLSRSESALRRELDAHKKTIAARGESEGKYRELFSRASDAIVVLDSRGDAVLDANDAALKLYGYTRKEFLNLTARDLAAEPEETDDAARPPVGSGRALVHHRTKDERAFPVEITRGSMVVQGRNMVMMLARDMTEHMKAAEAERLREREAMQRQLIATVSHELRTPIAAIKVSVETLRRGGAADGRTRPRLLNIIERQASRLGGIVEDLLFGAAIESGKVELAPCSVELKPFIERFVKDIVPLAASRAVSIRVKVNDDMDVWVDQDHLTRILQNLLDNAIKYNNKRGSVHVESRKISEEEARISISDTGIGIDAKDLPNIFQQFFRTEKARALCITGSGLGLFILKTIVESNGGRIWAESAKDKGSVFHFTLPLASRERFGPVRARR